MTSRRAILCSSLPGAIIAAGSATWAAAPTPDDAITALLAKKIDQDHISPGIIVGVLDAKGRRVLAHGRADAADDHPLDGDSIFDVGSLTKLFTALILADMVVRGEVVMSDPLARYLPPEAHVPDFAGKPIALLDLVTYSPGLPGWPSDMPPLSPDKPFPDYSSNRLYKTLSATKLDAAPGTRYVYSNFGYGLLALALSRRAGMDFESLVVTRVCKPLGMESTRIALSPALEKRVAPGHGPKQERVTSWTLPPAFAGAGAFRSTANDLLKFLAAAMGSSRTSLAPAFAAMLKIERPGDKPDTRVGAGWFITTAHDDRLVWKDGGVLGYASFLGYSTANRKGVVVLINAMTGTVNLGKHLLDAEFP
jgi:CubicO group peptidase (beta-lactamase class C family)